MNMNYILMIIIILIIYFNYNTIVNIKETFNEKNKFDLDKIYDGITGFAIMDNTNLKLFEIETIYGEVTSEGIDILSSTFNKYGPLNTYNFKKKTFYDLGCGVGKIVVKMAYLNPDINSIGYEIVSKRVENANKALENVKKFESKELYDRISIKQQDLFDNKIDLSNACWIFISNLCFKNDNLIKFAKILDEKTPNNCVIICSKTIDFDIHSKFKKISDTIRIPMSWEEKSNCIIYKKN